MSLRRLYLPLGDSTNSLIIINIQIQGMMIVQDMLFGIGLC